MKAGVALMLAKLDVDDGLTLVGAAEPGAPAVSIFHILKPAISHQLLSGHDDMPSNIGRRDDVPMAITDGHHDTLLGGRGKF